MAGLVATAKTPISPTGEPMPDFMVQVMVAGGAVRRVRVQAADLGSVGLALGVPAAQVLSAQAVSGRDLPVRVAGAVDRPAMGLTVLRSLRWRRRVAALDLRLFSQELSVLLDAGIPLLEALDTLCEKSADAHAVDTLARLAGALRDGQPLSQALAAQPATFDALFVALVAASERSGQLPTTLRGHAAWLAWRDALRDRLQAALIYPLLLMGAGGAVVMFLLLYVLPRFAGVFDGLGSELPAASRGLIALGVWTAAHPAVALALAALAPMGGLLAWGWPPAQQALQRLAWRSPGLGPRLRTVALARLYRCLGLLIGAGVPVPAALALTQGVLAPPLHAAGQATQVAVASGIRLSQAMQTSGLATPVAWRMLRVGESSGSLSPMLVRAAAFHDEEIARLAEFVTRAINPVLMLVMGVLIGGIVVLMYLPIFGLMEQVQ